MAKIHKKIGFIVIGLIAVVGIAAFLWSNSGWFSGEEKKGDYVAVYMSSGDIYFGKLERFPKLTLANAYTFQRTDDKQPPFTLVKFGASFWGPKGSMELSEDNVLWIAELSENSLVLKSIKEQENGQ